MKNSPLFAFIQLTPVDYWRILLFKDMYNYGGIKEGNNKKVTSKWDIALHLPEAIQKKFVLTIGEFILKVYKYNQRIRNNQDLDEDIEDEEYKKEQMQLRSNMDIVDDVKKERDHDYISRLISDYFSQKLFTLIGEIFVRKEDKESMANDNYEDDDDLLDEAQQEEEEEQDDNDYMD